MWYPAIKSLISMLETWNFHQSDPGRPYFHFKTTPVFVEWTRSNTKSAQNKLLRVHIYFYSENKVWGHFSCNFNEFIGQTCSNLTFEISASNMRFRWIRKFEPKWTFDINFDLSQGQSPHWQTPNTQYWSDSPI